MHGLATSDSSWVRVNGALSEIARVPQRHTSADEPPEPVDNSAAAPAILDTLPAMTSKLRYATVAFVVATSLPLAGCASEGRTPASRTSTPTSTTTPTPSPTAPPVILSVDRAKAVSLLSQRATGNVYPGTPRLKALDWEVCGEKLTTDPKATWLTGSSANAGGDSMDPSTLAKVALGGAYSVVTILEGAAETDAWDARLAKWKTSCPDADDPVTPMTATVPGADATFSYAQVSPKSDPTERHVAVVMARTRNAGVICWLAARDPAAASAATMSCARDMVQGARLVTNLGSASGSLGARALLASVATDPKAKSEVTFDPALKVGPPCGPMTKRVMTAESAFATFRPAGTGMYEPATASAGVTAMDDPAAAKARVAQARKVFGGCAGKYQFTAGSKKFPARVLGVDEVAFGDGGIAIRDEVRFGAGKPEPGYTAIFSVGQFVVQVDQWRPGHGELVAKAIAEAAK